MKEIRLTARKVENKYALTAMEGPQVNWGPPYVRYAVRCILQGRPFAPLHFFKMGIR